MNTHLWRRVGTAVVRWPAPILAASTALALIGLLALPPCTTNYNDRNYLPRTIPPPPVTRAADRHFPQARMNPRTAAGGNRPRCAQSGRHAGDRPDRQEHLPHPRHRARAEHHPPLGTPIEHTSIPFIISMQGTTQMMNMSCAGPHARHAHDG